MKIANWLGFIVILIICFCFFRYFIEKIVKKIKNKLDSLECDIVKCREEIRKTKEEFELIQEELKLINEKLVVGKKNEKICQLVDKNKELEEEIKRLDNVNQELVKDYWNRLMTINSPFVTSFNGYYNGGFYR